MLLILILFIVYIFLLLLLTSYHLDYLISRGPLNFSISYGNLAKTPALGSYSYFKDTLTLRSKISKWQNVITMISSYFIVKIMAGDTGTL